MTVPVGHGEGLSTRLINPLAVADFDHHARALIEADVIVAASC